MAVLSDQDIRRWAATDNLVEPFDNDKVQPASVDLTLDDEFSYQGPEKDRGRTMMELERGSEYAPDLAIDLANVKRAYEVWPLETVVVNSFRLEPGDFILGSTFETVSVPEDMVARVEGKSSLGRLGLLIHATAGFIDPGFKGTITLEICNLNDRAIILRPGLAICQISYTKLTSPATEPYGHPKLNSKYQGQDGVVASRYAG